MFSMFRSALFALYFLCLSLTTVVSAATVSGRITDASNGKPIVFATVRILELGSEVHTDADGQYVFGEVPAGRFTVAVTFAGYSDYVIGIVETQMEGQKTIDAALQADVASMYEQDTDPAGLPLEEESKAGNSIHDGSIRLSDMPIRGYEDYVGLQAGTVRRFYGAPVHVRGGRIEEFGYDVDGFPQQDPFTGRSFTAINGNTIDDIRFQPGYNDPSHGWLASGRAQVTTRETWASGGSFEAITDNFHGEKSDYNLYALDLSGPLIVNRPGQLTYAVAGEYRTFGSREIGGIGDWNYLGAWHANLRWRPSDQTSALIGTRGSYEDWKYTPRAWYFNSVHSPRGVDENYSAFGRIEHDISRRTKLSASANWFSVNHRQGDGVYFDNLWAYGRPTPSNYSEQTSLFYAWDDMLIDPDSQAVGRHIVLRTPIAESTFTVPLPDGSEREQSFVVRGDESSIWNNYLSQKGSYIGGALAATHDHGRGNTTKMELEFERHTARSYNNLFLSRIFLGEQGGFDDLSRYGYNEFGETLDEKRMNGAKNPIFIAGSLNQHMNLDELLIDVGLRWDHFNYDTDVLIDPRNPLDPNDNLTYADTATGLSDEERQELRQAAQELGPDDLTSSKAINQLSPRLRATLSVGEECSIFFTAGRYVQKPAFDKIYLDYDFLEYKVRTGGYSVTFPNPLLPPTEAIQFVAGVSRRMTSGISFTSSLFQKRFEHISAAGNIASQPYGYSALVDAGSATAKGIELKLSTGRHSCVATQVSYTLTDISDDQLYTNTQSNIAWVGGLPERRTQPFTFEQTHRLIGILDLQNGPNRGPRVGEWRPLENSGVTVLAELGSGFPYSPTQVHSEIFLSGSGGSIPIGQLGSGRTQSTFRVDLKANKALAVRSEELELYLWVINLFNRENVADVYPGTGKPNNTGWLETPEGGQFVESYSTIHDASFLTGEQKYNLRQINPANFDIPRQIRLGMRVSF